MQIHKVHKVVKPDQLEWETRLGWSLVCVIQQTRVQTLREIQQQGHNHHNGSWVPEQYQMQSHIVSDPMFLVEKDQEIINREEQLEANAANAREELRKLKLEFENAGKQIKTLEEGKARDIKDQQQLADDVRAARDAKRKLEGDLAKVRAAIGDLKWKEIVG